MANNEKPHYPFQAQKDAARRLCLNRSKVIDFNKVPVNTFLHIILSYLSFLYNSHC